MINFRFRILSTIVVSLLSCSQVPALADPLEKTAPLATPEAKLEAKKEAKKEATQEAKKDSQSADAKGAKDNKLTAHPTLPGSEINRHDPLSIYREAGIDKEQEKKIRQLAK